MNTVGVITGFLLLGYLAGSLPFALWVTRLAKGIDVRSGGSGHATATNTIRQAGWPAGIAVLILDIGKGFIPTYLAMNYSHIAWLPAATGAMVVVGHCWSILAGFRGGMGLAAAGGAILAVSWLGFVTGLGVLVAAVLIIHHAARATVLTGVFLAPVFWLFKLGDLSILTGAMVGLAIAVRFLIDWNRQYKELWLDRNKGE